MIQNDKFTLCQQKPDKGGSGAIFRPTVLESSVHTPAPRPSPALSEQPRRQEAGGGLGKGRGDGPPDTKVPVEDPRETRWR